ncbi:unnamed protein product [Enterobius vermicularis]|uniref:GRIP domain-containing protein n=1 Tax=Enterobius vermicularis TaxID=51028 RepID=A0A0N4V1U4_ENTVE|nr:unnamed protein product [Enterobius vermicularis]
MSAWLRNLQGQLSELASEVLSEATEEVEDPGSELQVSINFLVTKKKLEELERQLLTERSNSELLQNKIVELNEQLYSKNIEMDTVIKKYVGMVESRDQEIRSLQVQLKVELERSQHKENSEPFGHMDDDDFLSETSVLTSRLRLKNEELVKEVQHWKRIANGSADQNQAQKVCHFLSGDVYLFLFFKLSELESKLEEQKQKSEAEMAALIQTHRENIEQLRNFYEEKIISPQSVGEFTTSVENDFAETGVQLDVKISQNEFINCQERIKDLMVENEKIRDVCDRQAADLNDRNSEISGLQSELQQAHQLIDIQRGKFEMELSEGKEKIGQLLEEAKNAEQVSKATEEKYMAKDHELEKLKRENRELTAAYNDLNEEFENHRAEHGSVVTSNRDLTMRIDALKANLIEYEEKYELCKAENAETAKQLEKLTNDFENLRVSFESTKDSSSFDSVSELERLKIELENVKHDRERLRADVDRFTQSVKSIDVELNKLRIFIHYVSQFSCKVFFCRTANKKLQDDNAAMASNLDMFMDIRDTLEKRDQELKKLYGEIVQLQEENSQNVKNDLPLNDLTRQALASMTQEKERLAKELEESRALISEQENSIRRYRSIVGNQAADIVELKDVDGKSSSEGTTDSNNEWVKVCESLLHFTGDWDVSSNHSAHHLMEELKEALAMVTEKTDECDELRRQKVELEKEVWFFLQKCWYEHKLLDVRQNCVDELMAQTNSLQEQQQIQAESFNEMREWVCFLDDFTFFLLSRRRGFSNSVTETFSSDLWFSDMENICDAFISEQKKQQKYLDDATLVLTAQETIDLNSEIQRMNSDYETRLNELKDMHKESIDRCNERILDYERRISGIEEEKLNVDSQLDELRHKYEELEEAKQSLESRFAELATEREKKRTEVSDDRKNLEDAVLKAKAECTAQAELNAQLVIQLKQKESDLLESERIRSELVTLVEQKHAESTNYHAQLQSVLAEKDHIQCEISAIGQKMSLLDEQLSRRLASVSHKTEISFSAVESKDKAEKENERLRQHLLGMEETFTRDAVAAEEREIALRDKIRRLELKTEETADTVISSSNAYEKRLEELSNELSVVRSEKDQIKEELAEKSLSFEKTEKALSDLRKILRDIDADHASQLASYESQISKLEADIQVSLIEFITGSKLEKEMGNLYASEEALLAEKDTLKASDKQLREEITKKDAVIDELETQLDEKVQMASGSPGSTYRIDDETLRQLFLSYFTAEPNKKPEIAVLLASILNYSPEDAAKIHAANASANRTWFGFGGVNRSSNTGPSISELFIRFLERESLGPPSHPLPLHVC